MSEQLPDHLTETGIIEEMREYYQGYLAAGQWPGPKVVQRVEEAFCKQLTQEGAPWTDEEYDAMLSRAMSAAELAVEFAQEFGHVVSMGEIADGGQV